MVTVHGLKPYKIKGFCYDCHKQLAKTPPENVVEPQYVVCSAHGTTNYSVNGYLNVDEFRGFVLVDEYAPLIFINGADSKAAQMFSLGHELAHVWLGQSASFDLRVLRPAHDPTEQACNRIAAEFLVPTEELKSFWPPVRYAHDWLRAVAQQFKVSELVAARRAFDLNLIDKGEYFRVYEQYQKKAGAKRPAQKTGNFYQTQKFRLGKKFSEGIICAVREGQITYDEAYHLTGLYGKTFEKYAQSVLGE